MTGASSQVLPNQGCIQGKTLTQISDALSRMLRAGQYLEQIHLVPDTHKIRLLLKWNPSRKRKWVTVRSIQFRNTPTSGVFPALVEDASLDLRQGKPIEAVRTFRIPTNQSQYIEIVIVGHVRDQRDTL